MQTVDVIKRGGSLTAHIEAGKSVISLPNNIYILFSFALVEEDNTADIAVVSNNEVVAKTAVNIRHIKQPLSNSTVFDLPSTISRYNNYRGRPLRVRHMVLGLNNKLYIRTDKPMRLLFITCNL